MKIMFAKIELWFVLLLALLGLLATMVFGWAVLDTANGNDDAGKFGKFATAIAEVPMTAKTMLIGKNRLLGSYTERLKDLPSGWSTPEGEEFGGLEGYLLLTRHDGDRDRSVVQLVSLKDSAVKHEWWPDGDRLLEGAPRTSAVPDYTTWHTNTFRAIHPVLMPNGDLVVKDNYGPLIRIDACANKVWREDTLLYSHSSEMASDNTMWVVADPQEPTVAKVPRRFFDDSIALVSTDGKLLDVQSMTAMLSRHGYDYLLFGAGNVSDDPIHMNDIEPVLADGPYWKKGDLFLSFRHLSMLVLYRPATDEIIWEQTGPWMGQHDVDILNDHQITLFNNNALNRGLGPAINGNSEVLIHDFANGETTSPWHDALTKADLKTFSEGLTTLLPGGYRYIEENNAGRSLILSPEGQVVRQFVNRSNDNQIFQMDWSRYVTQDQGDAALAAMKTVDCGPTP